VRLLPAAGALALAGLLGSGGAAASEVPFFTAREQQVAFHGPGREAPGPEELEEVRIGYFGPSDPDHPEGGDLWLAASLALEEENELGGYEGIPFRLIPGWAENPWGTGVSRLAHLVYRDRVWAVIGSIDGSATHLAEQVVAKSRVPLLNPAASDHTVHMANVPWMFSCLPGDDRQAEVLAGAILERAAGGSFVLLSTDDHDARVLSEELLRRLGRTGTAPLLRLVMRRGESGALAEIMDRVLASSTGLAVVIAGPADSARTVAALRAAGYGGAIVGGPAMGRRLFRQEAGPAGEAVVFPLLYDPVPGDSFAAEFQARFGRRPDYAAAHAYDSVRLLARAVRRAGLNRARIRDALEETAAGATGTFRWDSLGQNDRPVALGTLRGGRVVGLEDGPDPGGGPLSR
jgi:ABC-type branched-subunit amino acid transport system substrate-binding protein